MSKTTIVEDDEAESVNENLSLSDESEEEAENENLTKTNERYLPKNELFFESILKSDMKTVLNLLHEDPSLLEKKIYDYTPLELACMSGNLNMVNYIHSKGLDIIGKEGSITPLHLAVAFKEQKVVEFLIENGANPFFKNNEGNNALKVCILTGSSSQIFEILFKAMKKELVNIETTNDDLTTPIDSDHPTIEELKSALVSQLPEQVSKEVDLGGENIEHDPDQN